MKKSHLSYLQHGVSLALTLRASDTILTAMEGIKRTGAPVYGIIRDIVSDVRFYSVTESDAFWRRYSAYHIRRFIDGIAEETWQDLHALTGLKEDFLNDWFADHLFHIPEEEKKEKLAGIEAEETPADGLPENEENEEVKRMLRENREKGMRIYGVSTSNTPLYASETWNFREDYPCTGFDFFNSCDFRYLYTRDKELINVTKTNDDENEDEA